MIGLLALVLLTPPTPIDPVLEVSIIEATFDQAICPMMDEAVTLVAIAFDDYLLAFDMVSAWAVEQWEVGYERNLTEEGEDALEALLQGCL